MKPTLRSAAAAALHERVLAAWPAAVARWSSFLVMDEPVLDSKTPHIAQIHLGTRCVSLNDRLIMEMGVEDCIPAMLAHELGHHVCYPGTLQVQARLLLLERTLLPDPECSLVNLFTDLMINERLGRTELRSQMIRIYQAGVAHEEGMGQDPSGAFYLALYEALWDLKEGEILGAAARELTRQFPLYRADAQLLAQDLFMMGPNLYTQFLYFLSVSIRYLIPGLKQRRAARAAARSAAAGCSCGDPSASDWGQAITPSQAEREAIRKALEKRWFDRNQGERMQRALDASERMQGLPGMNSADASQVPAIMAAFYRQKAEGLLFRPPAQPRIGEAVLPGVLEDWQPEEPAQAIDWLATLQQRGPAIGAALPLKRLHEAERDGEDVRFLEARMEIYLDVSGSMPNPCLAINPMTLAAQVLVTATIRAGGQVRLALYSHTALRHWDWCRSENELSGFLMHYIGGGTAFPFEVLEQSARELAGRQPIRVIITDQDFDANVEQESRAPAILAAAVKDSPGLILLKSGPPADGGTPYRRLGIRVLPVAELTDYPRLARELAWALFPEGG
jgi:hypothetical protein